ncbi:hypothetical protein ACFQVB_40205 [Paraburkholderia humisilvae]|uniref:hypothetical protein n=1 Tax=Paraburkholderia humisilvae TaxID=627669 RepID=UPI00360F6338
MAGATVPFPNVTMRRPVDDGVSTADGSVGLPGFEAGARVAPSRRLCGEIPLQIITGQV